MDKSGESGESEHVDQLQGLTDEDKAKERSDAIEAKIYRGEDDPTSRCTVCGFSSRRRDHVRAHVESFHVPPGNYQCPTCLKIYTTRDSFRRHVRKHHSTNV